MFLDFKTQFHQSTLILVAKEVSIAVQLDAPFNTINDSEDSEL